LRLLCRRRRLLSLNFSDKFFFPLVGYHGQFNILLHFLGKLVESVSVLDTLRQLEIAKIAWPQNESDQVTSLESKNSSDRASVIIVEQPY
jgi:hypothetical protein